MGQKITLGISHNGTKSHYGTKSDNETKSLNGTKVTMGENSIRSKQSRERQSLKSGGHDILLI